MGLVSLTLKKYISHFCFVVLVLEFYTRKFSLILVQYHDIGRHCYHDRIKENIEKSGKDHIYDYCDWEASSSSEAHKATLTKLRR